MNQLPSATSVHEVGEFANPLEELSIEQLGSVKQAALARSRW